jgi:RNA polymerase sigma-70 factor (ECF subfamily)
MATLMGEAAGDETRCSDLATLEVLYDTYHRLAIGLAFRILGDMPEAEDAVQEAFLAVWRALDRYDPERGSQRTWLLSIVRNRSLDALRHRRLHPTDSLVDDPCWSDGTDVARVVEVRLDGRRARSALDKLPHAQRRTIELAYFAGLTHAEMAALMAVPLGTIKGRVRLGLYRLRSLLDTTPATAAGRVG